MDWQQIYENLYYTIKQPAPAVFTTQREIEKGNTSIMYSIVTTRQPSKKFWQWMNENIAVPAAI